VASRGVRVVVGDITQQQYELYRTSKIVAWDTETTGLDWELDSLATCQLFSKELGTIICQVDGHGNAPWLTKLLTDQSVTKIFHHAPFDLRFMYKAWGVIGANVRCTKVASKLLRPTLPVSEHSLKSLLSRELGVAIVKGAVRTSDWSAPDLTNEQLSYAASDVEHLLDLHASLDRQLTSEGLHEIYVQCYNFLPTRVALEVGHYPDVFAY
jgi:ribonuclease D